VTGGNEQQPELTSALVVETQKCILSSSEIKRQCGPYTATFIAALSALLAHQTDLRIS
jgi:hypothetical protein